MGMTLGRLRWRLVVLALAGAMSLSAHGLVVERELGGGVKARVASFELPGQSVQLRSLVPDGRGGVFMVVAARPESADAASTQLLSLTGRLGGTADLQSRALRTTGSPSSGLGASDASPSAASMMAADDQGTPYAVAVALNGAVQLTRFGISGRVEQAFNVALEVRSVAVRRLVWAGAGSFVIAGSAGSRPLLVTVDAAGRVRNHYVVDEENAAAVAAVALPDGSLAALIEKGTPEQPRFVLVIVRHPDGVVRRVELDGRPMDLATGPQGQVVVLAERGGAATREVTALSFNANLEPRWQRSLLSEPGPLARFRIVPAQKGGFLVAGRKLRGLWLSRLSDRGEESWTSWTDPRQSAELEMMLNVELARFDDQVLVAYSAMVVRDRRQFSVVRAMQFRLD